VQYIAKRNFKSHGKVENVLFPLLSLCFCIIIFYQFTSGMTGGIWKTLYNQSISGVFLLSWTNWTLAALFLLPLFNIAGSSLKPMIILEEPAKICAFGS
jgi:hypothetical protein